MEERNGSVETNTCKRQRVCEEEVEDRISSLLDSILIHILSFLPTKDAVRTVLVPGFRHLWTFLPTLTFDHSEYDNPPRKAPFYNEKFLHFIRNVLIGHLNGTIDNFVLKLDLSLSIFEAINPANANRERRRRMESEVDSWVHFAMRKSVKVLHLDFMGSDDPNAFASYSLPSVVFRGKYLTELKLVACHINPSGLIQLNCLKRLFLKRVTLNDEIINQILSGCPMLEELSLTYCYHLCRLAFKNPSLKRLSLILDFHCINFDKVEISCPNIESLDIVGHLELVDLLDVSSVVVSSTSFYSGFGCHCMRYENVKALLKKLGHCKIFTPCGSCILVFSAWQLRDEPVQLFGWKCLEFEVDLMKWQLPGISCLLRSSPYLETLAMYFYPGNKRFKPRKWLYLKCFEFDGANFWRSQDGTDFHCLKNHLKTIKIYGHITEPYVIDCIEFLLKHAMVLEKLEISTHKTLKASSSCPKVELTTEQRLEFSQKLFSVPRASTSAVIHFA